MGMIDRTRKEGIKNGFQVPLSLLAARTERAACWGDKFSGQVKEGNTLLFLQLLWIPGSRPWGVSPAWDGGIWWGQGGEGHFLGLAA